MKLSKGVSPLIASVLLIAFTMAIAAVLTAWISSFTTAQKEKTAIFEEKIQCNYGFLENDVDFTEYNETTGLFKTRIKNTGTTDLSIGKYQIWYKDESVPTMWEVVNPTNPESSIKKQDAEIIVLNSSLPSKTSPYKITKLKLIAHICDGVSTIISEPLGGWTSGNAAGTVIEAGPMAS